ncbi:19976_t:CDS:1, partial [Racocetra fulgida]
MSSFDIATIFDKKNKALPKPFNICSGFDMKYVKLYILKYIRSYENKLNQVFDNER